MFKKISLVIVFCLLISSVAVPSKAFCQNQLRYSIGISDFQVATDGKAIDISNISSTNLNSYQNFIKTLFFAIPPLAKVTQIKASVRSYIVPCKAEIGETVFTESFSNLRKTNVPCLYFEQGKIRKWSFVKIYYIPVLVHNSICEVFDRVDFTIQYDKTYEKLPELSDSAFESIASKLFVNYTEGQQWYEQPLSVSGTDQFDFLIVLSDSRLESAVSEFVKYKEEEEGFKVKVVSLGEITPQSDGSTTEKQIRNYIKEHYLEWGIKYVMLVGDVRSLPMCYMYPEPNETRDEDAKSRYIGRTPTDFFYAELDSNWDYDGDKLPGEFEEDTDYVEDFYPDIFVGRIPFDDPEKVSQALNSVIKYEKSEESFRKSSLLVGAMLYYAEEGTIRQDGALALNFACENYLEPAGFSVTSMYEKEGTKPSVFESDLPLTNENFSASLKSNKYGLILLNAHGSPQYVARKYWVDSNGNGKVDDGEIKWIELITPTDLNGYKLSPSVFYFASCETAWPERNSFAKATLSRGAAAFIGASRVSYGGGTIDPILENFTKHFALDNFGIGDSLWISLFEAPHFQKSDFVNLYDYNLYGDPSLCINSTYSTGIGISTNERNASIAQNGSLTISLSVSIPDSKDFSLGYYTDTEGIECEFSREKVNNSQEILLKVKCAKNAQVGDFTVNIFARSDEGKIYGFSLHVKVIESKFKSSDLNQDGIVNEEDLKILESSFGTQKGDKRYDSRADLNQDGIVNGVDLILFALNYKREK